MAIDVYLHIDGIKGESADVAHQGWIEVTSAIGVLHNPEAQLHRLAEVTRPSDVTTVHFHSQNLQTWPRLCFCKVALQAKRYRK